MPADCSALLPPTCAALQTARCGADPACRGPCCRLYLIMDYFPGGQFLDMLVNHSPFEPVRFPFARDMGVRGRDLGGYALGCGRDLRECALGCGT
eukprot:2663543-Rhodomonas_salina.1